MILMMMTLLSQQMLYHAAAQRAVHQHGYLCPGDRWTRATGCMVVSATGDSGAQTEISETSPYCASSECNGMNIHSFTILTIISTAAPVLVVAVWSVLNSAGSRPAGSGA